METPISMLMTVIIAVISLALGFSIAWILRSGTIRKLHDAFDRKLQQGYVPVEKYRELEEKIDAKENELRQWLEKASRLEESGKQLRIRLDEEQEKLTKLEERFQKEFQNIANKLLDEKSAKFTSLNAEKMEAIVKPLREKIKDFEEKVEKTHRDATKDSASLKAEITTLLKLNQKISEEASRLTNALKGDSQFQGTWGEIQLEGLLEKAGLKRGVHYESQESVKGDDGALLRPDYIIHLPEGKHLLLDSKVSLKAFEAFFSAESEVDRTKYLKDHVLSVQTHIKRLSTKNYQQVEGLSTPDYVLMFMPLEQAFLTAVNTDPKLYEKALEKNVAIVSHSTLLATLRTITYIWKNDDQSRNVMEIARQGAALYDKFVGFLEDMEKLGRRLQGARDDYDHAMNKLITSKRKGDTIIGRTEKLRELGANPSKKIPHNLLEEE